jgi:hypothetical protein
MRPQCCTLHLRRDRRGIDRVRRFFKGHIPMCAAVNRQAPRRSATLRRDRANFSVGLFAARRSPPSSRRSSVQRQHGCRLAEHRTYALPRWATTRRWRAGETRCPPLACSSPPAFGAAFRLSNHETASPSVIAKIPRGPARNGMVRRAASSTWIRGGGGGSFS